MQLIQHPTPTQNRFVLTTAFFVIVSTAIFFQTIKTPEGFALGHPKSTSSSLYNQSTREEPIKTPFFSNPSYTSSTKVPGESAYHSSMSYENKTYTKRIRGGKSNTVDLQANKKSTAAANMFSPVNLQINFQDSVSQPPPGWLVDYGQPLGLRTLPSQGSGSFVYGWSKRSDNTSLDMTRFGRRRNNPADTLLATLVHMQPIGGSEGIWEIEVPNGNYDVTLASGDGSYIDSRHTINVEGIPAIVNFVPTVGNRFKTVTVSVTVSDGLLTIDAIGGTNTKINYIKIQPSTPNRPSVVEANPETGSQNVSDVTSISTSIVNLPNGGIDNATLNSASVFLEEGYTGVKVSAHVNGTGGGDAITLVPDAPLKLNTTYVFNVTDSVKDLAGDSFIPYASNFTTGSVPTGEIANIRFTKVPLANTMGRHSSLTIGPDGKLYALSIDGVIKRFVINSDGTLQAPELLYSLQDAYGPRQQQLSVGFAFDPASTATNLIAYVTHDTYTFLDAPDWDGKITRLSGSNLQNVQDLVINLPRSAKDHVSNSIVFGLDGALYFTQGGTSAMGSADQTWSMRSEHLLSAAVLRLDLSKLTTLPLDVKTQEGGGTYNPYAPNAPLTIYASGVRNAYDLVWHSNGELYAATNGSAAGGNTPASVQGTLRPDGSTYNGPDIPALTDVQQTQKDFLFRIKKGGYYGHPNPLRGEYVLNGGNPTASIDPAQVNAYPIGTLPDANWRGYAFDFKNNKSPNGSIEYKSNTFGGALKGKLLIVRYSQNDDIIVLTPGGANKDIVSYTEGATVHGFSGFVDPLDLTEDIRNGNLYVSEYGGDGIITLLRPDTTGNNAALPAKTISITPEKLYDNDVAGGSAGPLRTITITNTAQSGVLSINSIALSSTNADQFVLGSLPAFPQSLNPQQSLSFRVAFNPSTVGLKTTTITISSNDSVSPSLSVPLRGLGTAGTSGNGEPSLQAVLNLLEVPVATGDDNPGTTVIHSNVAQQKAPLLGEEISFQHFVRADSTQPVTIEPLAVFGPTSSNPVLSAGWYLSGDSTTRTELFTVSNSPASNGQTVNVNLTGITSFDPGGAAFGFFSRCPFFGDRKLYSEDALNTFAGALPHHVRVYPYKDRTGSVVPFSYLIAFEETTSGIGFQDLVFVVRNVKAPDPINLVLTPIADATVRDGMYSSTNFGRDTLLNVKGTTTSGNERFAYLKFSLGKALDVLSAKLRFYGRNVENTTPVTASVFGLENDEWTETGLIWNNAPTALTAALGTALVNNQPGYYEVDVTPFVQAQFTSDKIVSFIVRDTAIKSRVLNINSRENIFYPPQLVLTTSAAAAPRNTLLFVENTDRFPSNEDYVASRLQNPWSRNGITFNSNHDTLRVRLYNKGADSLVISKLTLSNTANWKLATLKGVAYNPATSLPLTLASGSSADLQIQFIAADQASRVKVIMDELSIFSNDERQPIKTIYLHGLWQKDGEGVREPTAQEIISNFGFRTSTGFGANDLDSGANNKLKGNEVLTSYFVRVDTTRPVTARQMSAYHDCCNVQSESLRWYLKGQKDSLKTVAFHISEDAQTMLPRRSRGATYAASEGSFTANTSFGFRLGTQDWTDTLLNSGHKIAIKVWKVIDSRGQTVPNAYIISNDYSGTSVTNYDYNDNMYYITNVRPELGPASASALTATPSAVDFGEQFLGNTANFTLNLQSLGQVYGGGVQDPSLTITAVSIVGQNASEFTASMPVSTVLNAQQSTTMNVGFKPTSEGLKGADLLIYYNNAASPLRIPLYGIGKTVGTTVTVPFRIKSGSSTDVVVNGKTWKADTPYAFDNFKPSNNTNLTQISATEDDSLYLRGLFSDGDKKPFRYEMTLPNGSYWVRLHFAEIYWGAPGAGLSGGAGSRVMSVSIENQPRLINLDVAGEVGPASALAKAFPVTVTDSKLNINFAATVNRPMICGVEVYQFTSGGNSLVSSANTGLSLREQPEAGGFYKPRVYPNPMHQRFTIQFPSVYRGSISLQLADAGGRAYDLGKAFLQAGGVNMDVDVSKLKLKPGVCFLNIHAESGKTETIKLLLQ